MRSYIILRSYSDTLERDIRLCLPDGDDVFLFENSVQALDHIKSFGKDCLVFVHSSKIAINGSDIITMLHRFSPYTQVFVICDGDECKKNILNLDEDEYICDHGEYTITGFVDRIRELVGKACNRTALISTLESTINRMKSKVNSIEKRTELCIRKLQTIS